MMLNTVSLALGTTALAVTLVLLILSFPQRSRLKSTSKTYTPAILAAAVISLICYLVMLLM